MWTESTAFVILTTTEDGCPCGSSLPSLSNQLPKSSLSPQRPPCLHLSCPGLIFSYYKCLDKEHLGGRGWFMWLTGSSPSSKEATAGTKRQELKVPPMEELLRGLLPDSRSAAFLEHLRPTCPGMA